MNKLMKIQTYLKKNKLNKNNQKNIKKKFQKIYKNK